MGCKESRITSNLYFMLSKGGGTQECEKLSEINSEKISKLSEVDEKKLETITGLLVGSLFQHHSL